VVDPITSEKRIRWADPHDERDPELREIIIEQDVTETREKRTSVDHLRARVADIDDEIARLQDERAEVEAQIAEIRETLGITAMVRGRT